MISIIIATYNRAGTIMRSIESILSQTYSDIEIIVVDDGSTDDIRGTIASVEDSRIRYIGLPRNQGASVARNRGIAEAKGEYIMVWDSDDVLYPQALSRVLQELERDPSLAIVSTPARVLIEGKEAAFPRIPSGEMTFKDIVLKRIGSNEKVRIARAAIMKEVSYKARHIDFLVNIELIERGKWYHIDEYLGDVFNDPEAGSLTATRKKKNREGSIERAPHLASFLDRSRNALLAISSRRYADYCYGAAIGYLLAGNLAEARRFAWDAWRYHPSNLKYLAILKLTWLPFGSRMLRFFYR